MSMNINNDKNIPIDTDACYEKLASQEELYLEETEEEVVAILTSYVSPASQSDRSAIIDICSSWAGILGWNRLLKLKSAEGRSSAHRNYFLFARDSGGANGQRELRFLFSAGRRSAHFRMASSVGQRDWPQGVRQYSTFGGTWG